MKLKRTIKEDENLEIFPSWKSHTTFWGYLLGINNGGASNFNVKPYTDKNWKCFSQKTGAVPEKKQEPVLEG